MVCNQVIVTVSIKMNGKLIAMHDKINSIMIIDIFFQNNYKCRMAKRPHVHLFHKDLAITFFIDFTTISIDDTLKRYKKFTFDVKNELK